jgi:hypothetical protein
MVTALKILFGLMYISAGLGMGLVAGEAKERELDGKETMMCLIFWPLLLMSTAFAFVFTKVLGSRNNDNDST